MKKKLLTLCLVATLLLASVTGVTLAYFTDSEQATNEYAVGSVSIDLYETVGHKDGVNNVIAQETTLGKGSDDATTYEYTNIQPGDTMTKVVTVENTGKSEAYIALAIKQENYGNFNKNVDNYYEAKSSNERFEIMGQASGVEDFMQKITNDVWFGNGWGLEYAPNANSLRYMMKESVGTATGTVKVLGHGYANSTVNGSTTVYNYREIVGSERVFSDVMRSSDPNMEGNFDSIGVPHTRMWVIYLKVAPGASYEVDLTTVCPTYFDNNSTKAFEDMTLDVKAFAIQTAGFATAKDAFAEVFKAKDCFAY